MQHEQGAGDRPNAGLAMAVGERARTASDGVRTAGAYVLAVALMVVTITGLLAAVVLAR